MLVDFLYGRNSGGERERVLTGSYPSSQCDTLTLLQPVLIVPVGVQLYLYFVSLVTSIQYMYIVTGSV